MFIFVLLVGQFLWQLEANHLKHFQKATFVKQHRVTTIQDIQSRQQRWRAKAVHHPTTQQITLLTIKFRMPNLSLCKVFNQTDDVRTRFLLSDSQRNSEKNQPKLDNMSKGAYHIPWVVVQPTTELLLWISISHFKFPSKAQTSKEHAVSVCNNSTAMLDWMILPSSLKSNVMPLVHWKRNKWLVTM